MGLYAGCGVYLRFFLSHSLFAPSPSPCLCMHVLFLSRKKEIHCFKNFENYIFTPLFNIACYSSSASPLPFLQSLPAVLLTLSFLSWSLEELKSIVWAVPGKEGEGACSWILTIILNSLVWLAPAVCIFSNTRKRFCKDLQLVCKFPSCSDWWQKSDLLTSTILSKSAQRFTTFGMGSGDFQIPTAFRSTMKTSISLVINIAALASDWVLSLQDDYSSAGIWSIWGFIWVSQSTLLYSMWTCIFFMKKQHVIFKFSLLKKTQASTPLTIIPSWYIIKVDAGWICTMPQTSVRNSHFYFTFLAPSFIKI